MEGGGLGRPLPLGACFLPTPSREAASPGPAYSKCSIKAHSLPLFTSSWQPRSQKVVWGSLGIGGLVSGVGAQRGFPILLHHLLAL